MAATEPLSAQIDALVNAALQRRDREHAAGRSGQRFLYQRTMRKLEEARALALRAEAGDGRTVVEALIDAVYAQPPTR